MLTYTQIRQWAAEHFHEDPDDTALTNLFLRWTNQGLNQVASVAQWKWLEATEEFTLGGHGAGANTSQGITYFPHRVHRILSLWASGRGYRDPIMIVGAWELDALSPSLVTGLSTYLAIWGYYNCERDNPTTGTLVVTDAGGGTGGFRLEGVDQNGDEVVEDVTLVAGTATTTAQFAAGPDGLRRFYLHTGTAGITTVTSGGVQIARLAAGDTIREHLRTELQPAPVTTANHVVRYYKRIRQITAVTDIVDIPFEFEDLLFFAIGKRLAEFRGEPQTAMYYEQLFRGRVKELKGWQNREPGRLRGLRRMTSYGMRRWQGYG